MGFCGIAIGVIGKGGLGISEKGGFALGWRRICGVVNKR